MKKKRKKHFVPALFFYLSIFSFHLVWNESRLALHPTSLSANLPVFPLNLLLLRLYTTTTLPSSSYIYIYVHIYKKSWLFVVGFEREVHVAITSVLRRIPSFNLAVNLQWYPAIELRKEKKTQTFPLIFFQGDQRTHQGGHIQESVLS